jgi:hypothetical protein
MDIILSSEAIDLQECQMLVAGFFEDERPPRGSCGWIDWRLNGLVSRFLMNERLTGVWKEGTLIPSQGRVNSKMILLVGLGKVTQYSYLRLREICLYLVETLRKLKICDVCLSFPYESDYKVNCGKIAEVLLEGITDSLDSIQDPSAEEWIRNLRLSFAEGEDHLPEILLGIQTAQSVLKNSFPIRIFTPSPG